MKFLLLFIIGIISTPFFAQKVVVGYGEYTMKIESNISEDQAIEKARQYAQINAIENAFGKVIIQGNSTFIQNSSNKQQSESNNTFNFIADSYVNGEWLETIDEKKEFITNSDGSRWIKFSIKGDIREIKSSSYNCETYPLTCPSLTCKTNMFNNGQSFFIYFKSPHDGYLSIYFDDPYLHLTSRILPYGSYPNGNFPIKADQDYYLFSRDHDYLNNPNNIDELELSANTSLDQYKIYVLFSPVEFNKPILSNYTQNMLDAYHINQGYTLPPSLPSEKFQSWQIIIRSKNADIEMQTIIISVQK
jgi:hypothetical protein